MKKINAMHGRGLLVDLILGTLDLSVPLVPYESPYVWAKRKSKNRLKRSQYQEAVWKLQKAGVLLIVKKNNEKFLKLTGEGQLKILLKKAGISKVGRWDGKWRVLIFDIPEDSRGERDRFRLLLKKNNFIKLQASVFVSPYALNREALEYLRESGLINFIRILRVDEMDDDLELRKKFNLQNHSRNSRP